MNFELIDKLIDERYITKTKHPEEDLWILCYSNKTTYERFWTQETLACRGLIIDSNNQIIARPFKKFFNHTEHAVLPNEPFDVYEKMDGSLGILYWIKDKPFLATKNSFISEQAIKGTEMLSNYSIEKSNTTALFEIIYPENRIILDYGVEEKLVLLGGINILTGEDKDITIEGIEVAKKISFNGNIESLLSQEEDNKEGFVVRFKSGMRVKVKFPTYITLHGAKYRLSKKSIWTVLYENIHWGEYLFMLPDECYEWADSVRNSFISEYKKIEAQCLDIVKNTDLTKDRKFIAMEFKKTKYPSILFAMIDNRDYSKIIYKLIKPEINTFYAY